MRSTGPRAIAKATAKILEGADREHLLVFHINAEHRIIGYQVAAVGTLDRAPAHPLEVFKAAILASSAAIVVAHKHPTGDPTPSPQDQTITDRPHEAGKILGIRVLDHVVVGAEGRWQSIGVPPPDTVWELWRELDQRQQRREK